MSSLSEKVRTALYSKLNVASVVGSGKASAIYHLQAPESASLPFIVFQRAASKDVTYAFGYTKHLEDDIWMIKCLADEDSSSTKSPVELNEDILEAAEAAIGNELTLTGGSETKAVYRISDIPGFKEDSSDRVIYTSGFMLRVAAN